MFKTLSIKLVYVVFLITVPIKVSVCQWVTGNIDTLTHDNASDYSVSPNSMFIDAQNTLHVVWQKRELWPNGWGIYYAKKFVNGSWTNPIRISDTLYTSVYPSVVVAGKLNKVFISYVSVYSKYAQIKLAISSINETWSSINITTDSLQNRNPLIEIDKNENIHLTWLGMDSLFNYKVKYSSNKSGIWKIQSLDDNYSGDNYYATPSLSVSPNGHANIMYLSIINGIPRNILAENFDTKEGKWSYELLPESVNGSGILKISKKGKLNYIFHYSKDFQFPVKTYYTFKANNLSGWSPPELINENFDGYCTSVEIDDNEKLHLTLDSLELAFKIGITYYANNKSGIWQFSSVSATGNTFHSSFKLDKNGSGNIIASSEEYPIPSELLYLKSENNLIGIQENFSFNVNDYALFQNYPNPFNPSTNIKFAMPKSGKAELKVFDAGGREVSVLLNENLSAGSYEYTFDAAGLPSGIYFYTLRTGGFVASRKMLLVK